MDKAAAEKFFREDAVPFCLADFSEALAATRLSDAEAAAVAAALHQLVPDTEPEINSWYQTGLQAGLRGR